jgi:repressor LexA
MTSIQDKLYELSKTENLALMSLSKAAEKIDEVGRSPALIKYHLDKLEKSGKLMINRANGIQVHGVEDGVPSESVTVRIPVVGAASCGPALMFAEDAVEAYLHISRRLLSSAKNLIAVRAVGDSMNDAQVRTPEEGMYGPIQDGDFVIVDTRPRSLPELDGQYVLSVIDGKANIKKFVKRAYDIALLSESSDQHAYPPIIITPEDDYIVNGRVVMVCEGS